MSKTKKNRILLRKKEFTSMAEKRRDWYFCINNGPRLYFDDEVEFYLEGTPERVVTARVIAVASYRTFEEMLSAQRSNCTVFDELFLEVDAAKYYTRGDEREHGVIGYQIEIIG